jgi:hypothetical protein
LFFSYIRTIQSSTTKTITLSTSNITHSNTTQSNRTQSNTTQSNSSSLSSRSNTTSSNGALSSTLSSTSSDKTQSNPSSSSLRSNTSPSNGTLSSTSSSNTTQSNPSSSSLRSNTSPSNGTLSSLRSNTTQSNGTSSATSSRSNTTKPYRTSTSSNITQSNPSSSKSNTTQSIPISSSISVTNETIVTSVIWPAFSTDDDDYHFTVDEDKVSDGITDDNASDITNEHSDFDNISDNASTTSLSSSSSSNELHSSTSEDGVQDSDLNLSLLVTLTEEEEFLNQAFNDPTILLSKVHILLKRVRKLVGMIHITSNLDRYVVSEMKLKLENLNRRIENEHNKPVKYKQLTLDINIRWSSTFIMISRFLFYNSIIISLTHDPYQKIKLRPKQYQKLKKLSFTSLDWSILKALENVLAPFSHSTKLLSTRERPTLSISQSIKHGVTSFLTISENAPVTLENLLKKQLLLNFNFYFEKHVSDEQSRATLVCTKMSS